MPAHKVAQIVLGRTKKEVWLALSMSLAFGMHGMQNIYAIFIYIVTNLNHFHMIHGCLNGTFKHKTVYKNFVFSFSNDLTILLLLYRFVGRFHRFHRSRMKINHCRPHRIDFILSKFVITIIISMLSCWIKSFYYSKNLFIFVFGKKIKVNEQMEMSALDASGNLSSFPLTPVCYITQILIS